LALKYLTAQRGAHRRHRVSRRGRGVRRGAPESTLRDAEQLYRRIQHAVSAQPIGQLGSIIFSAGVAELRPEDDAVAFFQRADDALYRAKETGKGQILTA